MAKFLTTHWVASSIEDIIRKSEHSLVIVSPYLQLSKPFIDRLNDADRKGVKIAIIYKTDKLDPNDEVQLGKLQNLTLFCCDKLHAKCYFNEDTMVITSMNMYEYSEKNNREIGVLINKNDDNELFNEAVIEVKSIRNISIRKSIEKKRNTESKPHRKHLSAKTKQHKEHIEPEAKGFFGKVMDVLNAPIGSNKEPGFCIRCGGELEDYDSSHPLCYECFEKWNEHRNFKYQEKYCHKCGRKRRTSMAKPLCRSCYD